MLHPAREKTGITSSRNESGAGVLAETTRRGTSTECPACDTRIVPSPSAAGLTTTPVADRSIAASVPLERAISAMAVTSRERPSAARAWTTIRCRSRAESSCTLGGKASMATTSNPAAWVSRGDPSPSRATTMQGQARPSLRGLVMTLAPRQAARLPPVAAACRSAEWLAGRRAG